MKARARGFTLIELLVVIAIIGLLAAIVLASLNTARQKGRDAKRLADLKQIANAAAVSDNGNAGTAFSGCTSIATGGAHVSTCTGGAPDLKSFVDPAGGSQGLCAGALAAAGGAACDYTINQGALATAGKTPTTQNFEVCAYLETGGSYNNSGTEVYITQDGTIRVGCP
jgi:prepilin-type N-terminal cleavage/methylation domain-containing protein